MREKKLFHEVCSALSSSIWSAICKTASVLKYGFRIRLGDGSSSLWYDSWTKDGPICAMVDYVHISNSHLLVKDCWDQGSWKLDQLCTPLPEHIKSLIEGGGVQFFYLLRQLIAWFHLDPFLVLMLLAQVISVSYLHLFLTII